MPKRLNPETGRGYRLKDRAGSRNGKLVFTKLAGTDHHQHQVWEAVCDCGNTTRTSTPHKTRSCGCLQRAVAAEVQRRKALPISERKRRADANAKRQRHRRKTDPVRAMQARLSRLHRHALKAVGGIKTSPTFVSLGYTVQDFVSHIERQFVENMGWHNMADWQIDHIIPISEAKTLKDVIALNQLSNLRPLWARENNVKKDKRISLL